MKRFFDNRSKSADTLSAPCPHNDGSEPNAKKQKQSAIKNSVKRIFGSVRRFIPSVHKKKQANIGGFDGMDFQPMEMITKTAAMLEAEMFMERLGGHWTVAQLESRIAYLYKIINDSFERSYQAYAKDRSSGNGKTQTATDYLREIRSLQTMIHERRSQEQAIRGAEQALKASSHSIPLLESVGSIKRSNSVDILTPPQPPQDVPPVPVASPMSIEKLAEGIIQDGFTNDVFLENYDLSRSQAHIMPSLNLYSSYDHVQLQVPISEPSALACDLIDVLEAISESNESLEPESPCARISSGSLSQPRSLRHSNSELKGSTSSVKDIIQKLSRSQTSLKAIETKERETSSGIVREELKGKVSEMVNVFTALKL